MTYLERAYATLQRVRDRLGQDTASNKPTARPDGGDPMADELARIQRRMKSQTLDNFRAAYGFPTRAPASRGAILSYGNKVRKHAEIANCMELACAAAVEIDRGLRSPPWDLVTIGAGDHVFTIVGRAPVAGDQYPAQFGDWPADVAVCDVWADIACPARDFPARWRARMGNWHIMHRQIGTGAGPVDAESWSDMVDGPKRSFTAS